MIRLFSLFFTVIFMQSACTDGPISFLKKNNKKHINRADDENNKSGDSIEESGTGSDGTGGGEAPNSANDSNPEESGSSTDKGTDSTSMDSNPSEASLYNNVVWKRYRALENGMMRALSLSKEQLCKELDQFSCIDQIHLFNLGGNDPFKAAQGKRSSNPTILTPIAVERLAMHACNNRIELDKAAGAADAVVFKGFTLNTEPMPADQIAPLVTDLYRRILARDPSPKEIAKLDEFAKQGIGSEQFAKTACFVVASLYENIFI